MASGDRVDLGRLNNPGTLTVDNNGLVFSRSGVGRSIEPIVIYAIDPKHGDVSPKECGLSLKSEQSRPMSSSVTYF